MVMLTLTKTWINKFTTGAAVTGYRSGDDTDMQEMTGRIAAYAGGRQRAVTSEGVAGAWSFMLRQVSVTDTEILRTWLGQTVLVRDNRGRRMYGVLLAAPRTPWKEALDTYDVEVTVRQVTVAEDA